MKENAKRENRYTQTEYYMKRGNKGYFRNEFGKTVLTLNDKIFSALIYGEKYDHVIDKLIFEPY